MTDNPILPHEIKQIVNDRESGSVALLNRLISALEKELYGYELDSSDLSLEGFHRLLAILGPKLGLFAAMENFLASVIKRIGHGSAFPGEALGFISDYRSYWEESPGKIADNFLRQINPEGRTILTHSHSQTVISLLDQLQQRNIPFRVFQTLSVPGGEGKLSHERLIRM